MLIYWLGLPGAHTGLGFQEILHTRTVGKSNLVGESGTIVHLLTGAASAPWCPSNAGTACFTNGLSQDSQLWRVLTTANAANVTQGRGFQNTGTPNVTHKCTAFSGILLFGESKGGLALWSMGRATRSLVWEGPNPRNLRNPPRATLRYLIATTMVLGPSSRFRAPHCYHRVGGGYWARTPVVGGLRHCNAHKPVGLSPRYAPGAAHWNF